MRILLVVLTSIILCNVVAAQDSTRTPTPDTARVGGVDTIVVFQSTDSAHFSVSSKRLRLRGKADVTFRQQRLQSEVIIMDFGTSLLTSEGVRDTAGRVIGFPIFTDAGTEYAGESILYNFKTKQGRVRLGETTVEGGFYYGSRIKRVSDDVAFIEDGCFTTCDAPHPHFYFKAPEMKVVVDDKVFLDPIMVYVEDIPIFALPFGMFFSLERGRRSGIVFPTPLFSSDRGVVLQKLGYYFAISDQFETELSADVTSKGGVVAYSRSAYNIRDVMSGSVDLTYGITRSRVTDDFATNYGILFTHDQNLRPGERISALVEFTSSNLFRNTSFNVNDRLRQNARSNASYQRTFYNGHTLNAAYGRDQNIQNGSVTETPNISYGIPQFTPLKGLLGGDHWLGDLAFSYRANGRYTRSQQRQVDTGAFSITENGVVEHRPTLTVTPKLGYVTVAPSISYSENWFFQRYTEFVDPTDSSVRRTRESGFFRDYTYSVGVTASTILYGMARPNVLGITAFRHTLQPNIGMFYVPDQSDPSLGLFGTYVSPITGQTVRYNRFSNGGVSGIASAQQQLRLDLNVVNRFSIKVAQHDTLPDKAIDLLTVNVGTSYNMAADSLRLAPISMNVRTPFLEGVTFNATMTFNAYDQVEAADPSTGRLSWRTIDRTVLEAGKGLARLTNLNIQLGTRFSSSGISFASRTTADTGRKDSARTGLRDRFDRRINFRSEEADIFGDDTPGWSPVIVPWDVDLNLSYNYSATTPVSTMQSLILTVGGNLNLTETLRISARGSLDLVSGQVNTPVIDVSKRIHCWNLSINWVPTGFQRGFFLRFSADADQLRDLQITKQSTPLFR